MWADDRALLTAKLSIGSRMELRGSNGNAAGFFRL
jgi:hypothetical protein